MLYKPFIKQLVIVKLRQIIIIIKKKKINIYITMSFINDYKIMVFYSRPMWSTKHMLL